MESQEQDPVILQKRFAFGRRFEGGVLSDVGNLAPGDEAKLWSFLQSPKGIVSITGTPGTGKTYLCAAIFDYFARKYKTINQRVFTESDIISGMKEKMGDYQDFLDGIKQTHVLYIDDFGTSVSTDWRSEAILSLIDLRYRTLAPTIISTNLSETQIKEKYGERIHRRIYAPEHIKLYKLKG